MTENKGIEAQPQVKAASKAVVLPTPGELITSPVTGRSYEMGEKIGEGYFGIVFACSDGWENDLAAKVMKPLGTYEEVGARAGKELEHLVALRHPSITYIFDAFEYRDTFFLVTERCYCPLSELYAREGFAGIGWVLPIARSLLQAVEYLHQQGVAHQDIHAGNVFTTFARDEVRPKEPGSIQFRLGDLGVAKLFGDLDAANTRADWMQPPEAIQPEEFGPIDHRIDIYHVGLLLLELAYSKELRFTREEILAGKPREMALQLAPPLNFALEKALRRHAVKRSASAMEVWRDLHTPADGNQVLGGA